MSSSRSCATTHGKADDYSKISCCWCALLARQVAVLAHEVAHLTMATALGYKATLHWPLMVGLGAAVELHGLGNVRKSFRRPSPPLGGSRLIA